MSLWLLLLLPTLNPPAPANESHPYTTLMGFAMQHLSIAEVACKLRHPSPLKGSPLLQVPALLPGEV